MLAGVSVTNKMKPGHDADESANGAVLIHQIIPRVELLIDGRFNMKMQIY